MTIPGVLIENVVTFILYTFPFTISEVIMQLIVRGEQTHVLDVAPTANVQALRAQLSLLEVGAPSESLESTVPISNNEIFSTLSVTQILGELTIIYFQGVDAEQLNLFCSGAPLEVRLSPNKKYGFSISSF